MFYIPDLLSARRGRFGVIWLAAMKVRKRRSRKTLDSVNIIAACHEITSVLLKRTKLRLSLYLASQLTFGICLIYKEKVILLLRDLQELSLRATSFSAQSIDLPTCSRSKVRRSTELIASPKISNHLDDGFGDLELPDISWPTFNESSLEFMETQTLYQARAEDITMKEDEFPDTVGFGEDLLPTDLDSFFELEKDSHGEIGKQDLFATAPTQNGENQVSKCLIPEDIALEECPTVNRLVAMDESERVSSGVYGSSVQPIPPFQISPLRPVESVNVCSRKRGAGKKVAKKLIIDKDTRITSSEMRWNMLHSEQTIGRRNDILAESRSRSQVQYLLSRNLTRLFALPANLETALSSKLSEFWVRQRRVCEVALKQKISNGEIKDDLEEDELFRIPSMNESSSSMGTSTVREDNDASIEIHRFARDTSLVAPDSLLRGLIDISINQTSSIGESFAQMRDSLQKTREQFAANIAANLQNNAACESTPLNLPVHHTGTSQSQSTTLVPVLEEFEEQVQQPKEIGQLPAAPELTEAPPKAGPSHVPPSPPKLIKPLSGKSRLWRYIQGQLVDLSRDSIYFEELCPAGSTKKEAAFAFMSLLEFAKKRWVVLSQTEEFGQITIRLPSQ